MKIKITIDGFEDHESKYSEKQLIIEPSIIHNTRMNLTIINHKNEELKRIEIHINDLKRAIDKLLI